MSLNVSGKKKLKRFLDSNKEKSDDKNIRIEKLFTYNGG